jgi:ligand-binding sensor domain-containing protein
MDCFTSGKNILCLADEGQYLWVGTYGGGLVKLNKSTGEFIVYDKWNSKLPDNYVLAIAIDGRGTNGLELGLEGLQSLMELIGLFITLQILDCLITLFVQ